MENARPPIREEIKKRVVTLHRSLFARLRGYFFAGVLVTAPVAITIYLTYIFLRFVDAHVTVLLPPEYQPHITIPGVGLVISIAFFILVGWLTRNWVGRVIVWLSDYFFVRMPVVRIVYGAVKQIFHTLMNNQSSSFREVVLFECPRPGIWSLGFVTSVVKEFQTLRDDEIVTVFSPYTPNPASGYVVFVPRKDLIVLNMTVEEAIKMAVSGGIIAPQDRTPSVKTA